METKISRNELFNALQRCQGIVPARGTMSILSYVLLQTTEGGISVTATDLEVTLQSSVPAEVIEPGKVTLLARKVFEIVRELPEGEIHIKDQGNNQLQIASGKISFGLSGLPADDFPSLPDWDRQESFPLDSRQLNDLIRKTMFAIPATEVRYSMTGALLELEADDITMAGTDGHRLAYIKQKHAHKVFKKSAYILPRKVLSELKKILENTENPIVVNFQEKHAIFTADGTILLGRLIEGNFPNYQKVIPQDTTKIIVMNKDAFQHALRRVSILADEKSHGVKLGLSKDTLQLRSQDSEIGDACEEIAVKYSGEDFNIGFNASYVLDVLGAIDEEEISLELSDPEGPCLFHPQDRQDYLCVIMPMRVD